ncbi:MAG: RtcB family protein [Candidatus Dormibacteraeota bacterium]|nr:RtcB family protein [Candidatus Dormibacteraeota bacterium]
MTAVAAATLVEETPVRWRIPPHGHMRVPGVVFASRALIPDLSNDRSLEPVANVATLPGIVEASYAMPDMHWGYGFPIGGVAATDVDAGGVISPGGVGFDISCGVRLLATSLDRDSARPLLPRLMDQLMRDTPHGAGPGGVWRLQTIADLDPLLVHGARHAVERGHGTGRDLERCEDRGVLPGADPDSVSVRARERGLHEVGSIGSGNHFLEVQSVETVYDQAAATAFGLNANQVCVMIHCGSRGLGHQVCTDHVRLMSAAMRRYGISVPDSQLACVPVTSPEGDAYLSAMNASANYGRANRQLLTALTRNALQRVAGAVSVDLVYDISHNLAKIEHHEVDGRSALLCVHRKGATRALPPNDPELPADIAAFGQPVLVPGSMGTGSYVLRGVEQGSAFRSAAHGAGRTMSRHAALQQVQGADLRRSLQAAGIEVRAGSLRGLAEETPAAYKNVDEVVLTCERAGLAARVARLVPLGVVKG